MYMVDEILEILDGKYLSKGSNQVITNFSFDSRSVKNGAHTLFFAFKGASRDGHDYIPYLIKQGVCNFIVTEDKIYKDCNVVKVKDSLEALQKLAIYHRNKFNIPTIGITGGKGKTTVKEWLFQLLDEDYLICRTPKSYNSQLGVPLSLLQLRGNHQLGIFEASATKKGELAILNNIVKPTIGVLCSPSTAHFNEGHIEEEYLSFFKGTKKVIDNNTPLKGNYTYPFKDKISIENCNLCIAVLEYFGVEKQEIQSRINKLNSLALRFELFDGINNTRIINDAYSIDLTSLEIAIDQLNQLALHKDKSIIISDLPEANSYKDLIKTLNKQSFKTVVSIGNKKLDGLEAKNYIHFSSVLEFEKEILKKQIFQNEEILIKGTREARLEQVADLLQKENHQTKLTINLKQVEKNLKAYRDRLNPSTKLMVMVKAFSYGSGGVEIPKLLEHHGVDYFGVAYTDTGVYLRKQGILTPIMVMNPEISSFSALIEHNLEPEIYSLDLLDHFIRKLIVKGKKEYPIHLKLDTGMNRLGFKENDLSALLALLQSQPEVVVRSVFSHLSSADDDQEKEFTISQINLFDRLSTHIEDVLGYRFTKHIANTSAILKYPTATFDMVRLGIGLYGVNPTDNNISITPISTLTTQIIQLKKVKKGESVGYGRSYIADSDKIIAILPIGYADGIRRSLSNGRFSFLVKDKKAPIIGKVCMDLTMIDVTDIACNEGDEVEVFGKNNNILELAKAMGTIPYEVLTSISQRVKRVFIRD